MGLPNRDMRIKARPDKEVLASLGINQEWVNYSMRHQYHGVYNRMKAKSKDPSTDVESWRNYANLFKFNKKVLKTETRIRTAKGIRSMQKARLVREYYTMVDTGFAEYCRDRNVSVLRSSVGLLI